jgi:hypothetical protein
LIDDGFEYIDVTTFFIDLVLTLEPCMQSSGTGRAFPYGASEVVCHGQILFLF